ncbi:cytochrome P450 monooxygenase [Fomitopsis serialis]|uniref:cytochrome P450 monooxygenase n=1 Tax=Fomitopsis serialis TaxID=139415 RepID=UPI00200846E0|nr:cytochrome P450 monooxygenase [Neoantrodia serialis]KAH9917056.1 cytochrome P450 monooxygenase [Neoantrodia serialis]
MSLVLDLCATAVLGTAISIVYWVLKQWWLDAQYGTFLPPGPRRIPLVGNAHQLGLDGQHKTLSDWSKRYGDVIFMRVFNKPALVLNSAEAARDLLDKRSAKYSDRPHFTLLVDMFGSDPNPALMPYGPWWRQHRVWLHSGLMDKDNLVGYQPILRKGTGRLLSTLIDSPDDFIAHVKRFVGGLMLEIAYGHTAASADDELIMLADTVVREAMDEGSIAGTLVDYFPSLRYIPAWFPGGGFKRRAARIHGMMREMYDRPYEQAKAAVVSPEYYLLSPCSSYFSVVAWNGKASFLTTLLESLATDGDLTPEHEEHLKGAAIVLYTGKPQQLLTCGTDTTSTVLASFFLAMTLYPEVVKKAQDEIDRVVGNARLPDFEDRSSLPYLECILSELYRWNPPLYLGVPHRLTTDDDYRRWHIPRGSMIIPNIWWMLRNPERYPAPDTFHPERFQEMDPIVADATNPRNLVFGFGRRICPGRQLADQTLWLAIANILAVFNIHKARDADGNEITPEAVFVSGGISHPRPFKCEIRPRLESAASRVQCLAGSVT